MDRPGIGASEADPPTTNDDVLCERVPSAGDAEKAQAEIDTVNSECSEPQSRALDKFIKAESLSQQYSERDSPLTPMTMADWNAQHPYSQRLDDRDNDSTRSIRSTKTVENLGPSPGGNQGSEPYAKTASNESDVVQGPTRIAEYQYQVQNSELHHKVDGSSGVSYYADPQQIYAPPSGVLYPSNIYEDKKDLNAYHSQPRRRWADEQQKPLRAQKERKLPFWKLAPRLHAKLNRLEWREFKRLQMRPSCVIDVLTGEPDLAAEREEAEEALDQPVNDNESNTSSGDLDVSLVEFRRQNRFIPAWNALGIGPKPFYPVQGALPERIRINSWSIIRFFKNEIGQGFRTLDEHQPLIIVRPFRALVHYQQQIRDHCVKLQEKLGEPSTIHRSAMDGSTAETKSQSDWGPGSDVENSFSAQQGQQSNMEEIDESFELSHMECLLDFIDGDIETRLQYLGKNEPVKITFPDVWYLFKPGDEAVSPSGKQAFRIMSVTSTGHNIVSRHEQLDLRQGRQPHLISEAASVNIDCVWVDFDGALMGPSRATFTITRFDGEKSVKNLPILPFRFIDRPNLRQQLIERGKLFPRYTTIRHMHHTGTTSWSGEEIDGEVVIDFEETLLSHSTWKPMIEDLWGVTPQDRSNAGEPCRAYCCAGFNVLDDAFVERLRNDSYTSRSTGGRSRRHEALPSIAVYPRTRSDLNIVENPISDDEYLIMSNRVFGFVLHSRKWESFDIANLRYPNTLRRPQVGDNEAGDADISDESFDQLVLPEGHKDLVKSLIAQHFRDKASPEYGSDQTDIIRGKGKGLVLLLHGAPGVGKTTTAECVAAYFNKPLFHITCGDLGIWAQDVEKSLLTNFTLADRWGCILLLDEADVFLSSRTPTDHMRNSMVSVFLRVLEYYAGVLFLTTNRVGDFDEAFASRVHMSLYYPTLTKESTLDIFSLNLGRIKSRFEKRNRKFKVKDMEIGAFIGDYWNRYPEGRWNGRQIRNACQTALALAEFEAQGGNHKAVIDPNAVIDLQLKHFQRVADAYLDFMRYMKDVYGTDSGQRAKDKFLRADSSSADKGMPLRTRGLESSPVASEGPFQTGGTFTAVPPAQTGSAFQTGAPYQTGHNYGSFQHSGQAQPPIDPNRLSPIGHPQQSQHHFGGPSQGSNVSSQYGLSNPYSPVERGTSHFVPQDNSQQGQP